MSRMSDLGLLDCFGKPEIEENLARLKGAQTADAPSLTKAEALAAYFGPFTITLDMGGKCENAVLTGKFRGETLKLLDETDVESATVEGVTYTLSDFKAGDDLCDGTYAVTGDATLTAVWAEVVPDDSPSPDPPAPGEA